MVLGCRTRQSTGHGIRRREPELVPKCHCTRLHHRRMLDVVRWRCTIRGSAHILPPSAGPHPRILPFTFQAEDNYSTFSAGRAMSALFLSV